MMPASFIAGQHAICMLSIPRILSAGVEEDKIENIYI